MVVAAVVDVANMFYLAAVAITASMHHFTGAVVRRPETLVLDFARMLITLCCALVIELTIFQMSIENLTRRGP